ncbi:hypothetical protein BGZ65_008557 [Modicella reniformis]|uniref:Uncharacterized protein n=1 Tax=Modicella reniformis TaxID=1440133 RepID=A0A9P6JGD7_9FUNG|nr:hypothetical protein BGZ65_008557 [Modicella reniformis]
MTKRKNNKSNAKEEQNGDSKSRTCKKSKMASSSLTSEHESLQCVQCEFTADERNQLRIHCLENHAQSFMFGETIVERVDGLFRCELCNKTYGKMPAMRYHLNVCQKPKSKETEPVDRLVIVIPKDDPVPMPSFATSQPVLSTSEQVVLMACQRPHASNEKKQKTLSRVRDLKVFPYWTEDEQGEKRCSLAGLDVNMSTLTRLEDLSAEKPVGSGEPALESMLALSPLSKVLRRREYVALTRDYCDFLNEDWQLHPNYRYACARMLAGCLILNTRNGQALLVNTIEVYGRGRWTDIHRESAKNGTVETSSPDPTKSYYDRVLPVTMCNGAGFEKPRLVIGTDMFDGLVTCSSRVDIGFQGDEGRHSVGPSNNKFVLRTEEDCRATRIFLNKDCVTDAFRIANDPKAYRAIVGSSLHQLRQLRTAFHDPSTYYMCRAWGPLTSANVCHPFSIFTLSQNDSTQRGNGFEVGKLVDLIATQVLEKGKDAVLLREGVEVCFKGCKPSGKVHNTESSTEVIILGNTSLNEPLEALVQLMSTYVSTANETVYHFLRAHLKEN